MNEKVKKLWLEALRSGEYKQGQQALRFGEVNDDNSISYRYCCLGVLCDLYKKTTGNGRWGQEFFFDGEGYDSEITTPPDVYAWAEFGFSDPRSTLISKNDGTEGEKQHTFEQIADYIEANL